MSEVWIREAVFHDPDLTAAFLETHRFRADQDINATRTVWFVTISSTVFSIRQPELP